MRGFQGLSITLMTLLLIGSVAVAGQLSWVYQDTEYDSAGGGTALAMRGGNVWPVIFASGTDSIGLFPTGWQSVGSSLVGPEAVAVSSPNGEVAAVGQNGIGVVSTSSGWASLNALSVAFDESGRLWAIDESGEVTYRDSSGNHTAGTIGTGTNFTSAAIAVNGMGEVGIATRGGNLGDLQYHTYSALTGSWSKTDVLENGGDKIDGPLSLAFDGLNRPCIAGTNSSNNSAIAWMFDVVSNEWEQEIIPSSYGKMSGERISVVSDGADKLGVAFITSDNLLYYSVNESNTGWETHMVPTGGTGQGATATQESIGIAYDYEGIPVIAYRASDSRIWLAYDPVVVPEPVTLAMLACGAAGLLRKRR